jgi:1-acyl-sn-glycerol-3-phosphate acyltransferase
MIRAFIGRTWLRAFGWTWEAPPSPEPERYVCIAAPHTSAWDLPFTLGVAWATELDFRWLGKHTLFKNPLLGAFFRALGGVPVDRTAPHNTVRTLVEKFGHVGRLCLAIAPEGTRKRRDQWKSGFYHVAVGAGIPIALGYLDFGRRRGGIGGYVVPSGDVRADMDKIRAFYADIRGKRPECESTPRLKEEASSTETAPRAASAGG